MEIRPETRKILTAFGVPSTELEAETREKTLNLVNSLDSPESVAWRQLPLTALAQAYANAKVVSANSPFAFPDAVVDYPAETSPAPIAPELRAPLLTAVDEASESFFTAAKDDFKRGDTVSGTQNLYYAANCAVIGQAAIHGWPHTNAEDDVYTIVALATGTMPRNAGEVYSLLQRAPDEGMDLNSNHGAVKSVHQAALMGCFFEHGYTTELATSFAQTAAKLAKRLGSDSP